MGRCLGCCAPQTAVSHPRTAPLGNRLSSLGMAVAIGTALVQMEFGSGPITNWNMILLPMGAGGLIGLVLACKAKTTSMPELVALFNGVRQRHLYLESGVAPTLAWSVVRRIEYST